MGPTFESAGKNGHENYFWSKIGAKILKSVKKLDIEI